MGSGRPLSWLPDRGPGHDQPWAGSIVNVSSMVAHVTFPNLAVYSESLCPVLSPYSGQEQLGSRAGPHAKPAETLRILSAAFSSQAPPRVQ